MNNCLVNSLDQFLDIIVDICDTSSMLDIDEASNNIEHQLKEIIKNALNSPQPDQQINLLKQALNVFYDNPSDDYGGYLSEMYPRGYAISLFNMNYNENLATPSPISSTFEERAAASRKIRQKNFLDSKFKGSPNAKLYFKRSILNDMVETFLVSRSEENPRYFTSQQEMNENVRIYKQKLLDRVFEYFDKDIFLKDKVKDLPRTMYKDGVYTGVIEKIKEIIDSRLKPENFLGNVKTLEDFYQDYRDQNNVLQVKAERFLNAYNAWVTLQNFDTIVKDSVGTIIKVNDQDLDGHTGDLTKYEIKGRATNMWNNWTTSDDIADMSEVISDVTQALINTSRMYKWGSSEAFSDRYVSFNDFNYVIGFIKKHAFDPISQTIVIKNLEGVKNLSLYTKRILSEIVVWNSQNGIMARNEDGSYSNYPQEATWKSLISRINENPQRYLHAIFDILCNTNILDSYHVNDYTKNLIWSFNKELFGGDGNPRSLYYLHTITKSDDVYQIITQVAASTFPEEYLQYYEKSDGTINTRLLQDYAVDNIKNTLYQDIQQTAATLTKDQFEKFGVKYFPRQDQPQYLDYVEIEIPISDQLTFNIQATSNSVTFNKDYSLEELDLIWKNNKVQNLFKYVLGLNFEGDPDFKNAYLEIVGNVNGAIKDLGNLLGRVIFSSVVNNEFATMNLNTQTYASSLKTFLINQYGKSVAEHYEKQIASDTGFIPILPIDTKDALLGSLSMAKAINQNLLSQAQSKTGEGTFLANYVLSRMRNFYPNQIEMQCKKRNSAVKDLTFVINENGLFEGILTKRELKTLNSNQQSTKFSDEQSFQLAFVDDFVSGFILNPDGTTYLKNGHVSFLPTVNSDKPQIDGLLVNLYAKSKIKNPDGTYKTYIELNDIEIEQEMELEFKPMYENIIKNINRELTKVYNAIRDMNSKLIAAGKPQFNLLSIIPSGSVIMDNQALLNAINGAFIDRTDLGKKPKQRITQGLYKLITWYNQTHTRNPIMLSPHVHFVFDENGMLSSNKTLEALWGRFNPEMSNDMRVRLTALYKNEPEYLEFLQRHNITDPLHSNSFFKYQDYKSIKDLLDMKFKIILRGSEDVVRPNSEIKFLKGEMEFTDEQKVQFPQLYELNKEMKNWVSEDGLMIIAKDIILNPETNTYREINITNEEQLKQATNIKIHPMLSKLNRLDYLCTQQYTVSTVGSHYVHKGGGKAGSIIAEEAQRWLASNKRNVAATSTVHLYQNKQLNGVPSVYNMAIVEDIREDLYTLMGDLYLEGHAPLDGGMFVNPWMTYLENNSLAGESAGVDKKPFGTFYNELYAAGGIVKTAGFASTNDRQRRQVAWQKLTRNMTSRKWVKEFADENGNDIPEIIDITRSDYLNQPIDYTQAIKGQKIMYKRQAHDNPNQLACYVLKEIKSLGNNKYQIIEQEINQYGVEIGDLITRKENINGVETDIITIDNNWDLYTKIFGGYNSLEIGSDNQLTWSENSVKCMVHALNNVGYRKDTSAIKAENEFQYDETTQKALSKHMDEIEMGLDQDDIWQPLKYSDIHYTPNIGAIKSLQFNVNPDGDIVMEEDVTLNFMTMRLAQLGIQLDKEHHADSAEVSMPTQIIQALANRSYTSEYAKEVYEALATLTRQETRAFLDGIKDIIKYDESDDKSTKLVEEVTNLILENLLKQSGEENSVNAILKPLLEKAERGETISFVDDVKGKIPWSDPTIRGKLFSVLSTTLTNIAVKMKFAGSLSVICPAGRTEKLYGDRLFNSFTKIYDSENKSSRTDTNNVALKKYQQSVKEGNEVDSDGNNMLVFDSIRDVIEFPEQEINESVEDYQQRIKDLSKRKRLSLVSNLKTQHNYIIEFEDGKEEITINTPEDYFRVKNLILNGKKLNINLEELITPVNYDDLVKKYELEYQDVVSNLQDEDLISHVYNSLDYVTSKNSKYKLTYESIEKETGMTYSDLTKFPGSFVKETNSKGININEFVHKIYEDLPENLKGFNTQDIRNIVLDALMSVETRSGFTKYKQNALTKLAREKADEEYSMYEQYINQNYKKSVEDYENYYNSIKNGNIPVVKIYENVEKGRVLSAYNVRFTDANTDERFQIYDLDSVNLLFKLNNLHPKGVDGYSKFKELDSEQQQQILNQIFKSSAFDKNTIYTTISKTYTGLPLFDENFVENLKINYFDQFNEIIDQLYKEAKPRVHNKMQDDLFKLSANYNKNDKSIYVNGHLINPVDIKSDAYELIMPKIYQTQFGLQEFDDLQEILRDKDFFVKRGLQRFQCKLDHTDYDYELKNFNGQHYYILDKSKGIPEHVSRQIHPIFTDKKKGKTYRVDSDGQIIYEMSSDKDAVCKIGDVQIIVTDNPEFYIQNLNYNTLKVSPKRVTQESYDNLVDFLQKSKRSNAKNYLKAIFNSKYNRNFTLEEFKDFNTKLDGINYNNVKEVNVQEDDYKSVAQICNIILKNGRELHTSFEESLNLIAGRIPAQSQQSFMTQRVVGFDNSDINTAMVSTFQLFLQGSDLDIDAVTLLGYEFDKNGKFVAWSPYFEIESKEKLEASKNIPLPTGESKEIIANKDAPNNFFEVYDKYFGTLFKPIELPTGDPKTKNGVIELQMDTSTPEGLKLLAEFLRDFNKHGINIQAEVVNDLVNTTDGTFFFKKDEQENPIGEYNLFMRIKNGGSIGARPDQTYQMAQQLLDFANEHNEYLNTADEHLKDKMSKNYIVHYIYKTAESPCNQTEAMKSVDESTKAVKNEARRFAEESGVDTHAPGRLTSKIKMVGEGQAGKDGVGIGAVGIKANSITQFYISELLNYGSDWDKSKILFRKPHLINGKEYRGFANMYTSKDISQEEIDKFTDVMNVLNSLQSKDQITIDVAETIASMLSIAVDNAKDLALAKINSGPKLMGMYVYGLTLGIPIETLVSIMKSEQGMVLKEMTEGSQFNNDPTAFKILDVFDKLNGNITGDLTRYSYTARTNTGNAIKQDANIRIDGKVINYGSTLETLFAAIYPYYEKWYEKNKERLPRKSGKIPNKAKSLGGILTQTLKQREVFNYFIRQASRNINQFAERIKQSNPKTGEYENWIASMHQTINYISDMSNKAQKFNSQIGKDLKVLAEGAEEMRVLGSILGINKGLKPSQTEAESFIDNFENLIFNRKLAMGETPTESDRINFVKFMTSKKYQKTVIDKYEEVKHSVNIPHLLTKAPHFLGYLQTQMIPVVFSTITSINYRTLHKYRKNIHPYITNEPPVSIFKLFDVEGTKEKENILKGLENLVHHKLLTHWLYEGQYRFKIPKGFKYFTKKGETSSNDNSEEIINLWTDEGLATFKKYMEEVYIPSLQDNPELMMNNEFVKNLIKISYNKTPVHQTVRTYSLQGDLMASKGRQAELNAKMFADFQKLVTIQFQPELGVPSLADAFYIYSQYCYAGRKGKKSLMTLFDNEVSRSSLPKSFGNFIAKMDAEGSIECSKEELIAWCAPYGNQHLQSKYGYVTSSKTYGISLKKKRNLETRLTEEEQDQQEENRANAEDEGVRQVKPEKFGIYKQEYLSSQYDRLTKNHFLTPIVTDKAIQLPIDLLDFPTDMGVYIDNGVITNISFDEKLELIEDPNNPKQFIVNEQMRELINKIKQTLIGIRIPYKTSLFSDNKQETDLGILRIMIDQLINC